MAKRPVMQFKITLIDTVPPIWRDIQISDLCTFWDLHVAIQDAMGWYDCHLHQFVIVTKDKQKLFFGIPSDDDFDFDFHETLPSWEYKVKNHLEHNKKFIYEYDFGDGWVHSIEYEGEHEKEHKKKYPCCLAGEKACPPEDVGGIPGYYSFLNIIENKNNEEHESMLAWVGGHYDQNEFDPKKVKFDNPSKRWTQAFEENSMRSR